MDIEDINTRFIYTSDARAQRWRVMTPGSDGHLRGDCEDYALTVALALAGGSYLRLIIDIVTFRSVLWMVRTGSGYRHVALWHRGRGWIDNIVPLWSQGPQHRLRYPVIPPHLALLLAYSTGATVVISLLRRLRSVTRRFTTRGK